MKKYKTKQTKILKGSKGITLIALVITIIVLLILAAVSIATLTGDNGILTKAQEANERTRESTAKEQIEVEAMGSFDSNGKFNRETFKQRIQDIGGKVVEETEDEIIVELDGYEAVIDAKTGEIKKFGKGVTLVVEATQGEAVEGKVTIEIEVKTDVDKVDSIIVTNLDTGKPYPATVNEKGGTVEVDSNGTYKVEVKATIDGVQKTGETTIGVIVTQVAFTKAYGKIDVIWVNTENEKIDEPLAPVLNGENPMKKVYWKEDGTEVKEGEVEFTESEWYSYEEGKNSEDNTKSKWANAINTVNENEGYFVWIPRYAYRIIYYEDKEYTKVAGYCDGDGIREVNGDIHNNEDLKTKTGIEKVKYNGFNYIVHPAFVDESKLTVPYQNGGWDSDLPGIWVGKYESAKSDASATNAGSEKNIKIVPNVSSWMYIDIGNCYTNALNYDTTKESHLMKNSEWGAVAYLTHSQYGRNGNEVDVNKCQNNVTGMGSGENTTEYAYSEELTEQMYNGEKGQLASTTGNVYGIYGLSGGADEYIAAFNDKDTNNYETKNGGSFAGTDKNSSKYATKYSSDSQTPSYDSYIPGDATYEVCKRSDTWAWFSDSLYLVNNNFPFFLRGDFYGNSGTRCGCILCRLRKG